MRLGMVIDLKRCVGCNACTLACKQENGTPEGIHYARVVTREVGTYPDTKRTFLPVLCNHCKDAPCEKVCPTGATYIRPDGIVMIEKEKCIGCRACAVACPYLNRHFVTKDMLASADESSSPYDAVKSKGFEVGTMTKCNFCAHRIDQGLEPACVVTCPSEARIFGDMDEEDGRLQQLIKERDSWKLLPEANTNPSVVYLDE
jgi:molybdopterin-containing oxidoreductase family iron-sulfur binding subunit